MLLLKSPDGVDAISLHHPFLIQCPKTKLVHVVKKAVYNSSSAYYAVVNTGMEFQYITDDSILNNNSDKRYYFTKEKLKELIRSQAFTIAGYS